MDKEETIADLQSELKPHLERQKKCLINESQYFTDLEGFEDFAINQVLNESCLIDELFGTLELEDEELDALICMQKQMISELFKEVFNKK